MHYDPELEKWLDMVAARPVELHVFAGCFHGAYLFAPDSRAGRLTAAAQDDALRRAWWPQGTASH